MTWFRIHLPRFCSSFVQADPRTKVQAEEEYAKREGRQADEAEGRVGGGRVGGWEGVCLESLEIGWLECGGAVFGFVVYHMLHHYIYISFGGLQRKCVISLAVTCRRRWSVESPSYNRSKFRKSVQTLTLVCKGHGRDIVNS
jgi:hypothetical protein